MWHMHIHPRDPNNPWLQKIGLRPSWVTYTSVLIALIVLIVPLFVLLLTAILTGLVVYIILSLIAKILDILSYILHLITAPFTPRSKQLQSRQNVRIIYPD
jgi:hypothetical protein